MTQAASGSPDKPAKIGKYSVVDRLGRGAMGAVYRCHDPMLNRHVAVKLIASSLDQKDMLRARFVREAQSAAQLNHPNIVTVYEFGEHDGEFFMAMELLEGNDLKDVIAAKTQLTLDDKLNMMEQICDGLGYAHKQGVIHRDLKPGNMHVLPDGRIKVLDFGLARIQDSDVTKTGMVMGTPNYMSPEQVRGEVVGTRSEVFSIGIVFYELLTYSKPFEAESMHAVMFKVVECKRKPLSEVAPDLPPKLVALVEKCLAQDPDQRYEDARAVRAGLGGLRDRRAYRDPDQILGRRREDPHIQKPEIKRVPDEISEAPTVMTAQTKPSVEHQRAGGGPSPMLIGAAAAGLAGVLGLGWWFTKDEAPSSSAAETASAAVTPGGPVTSAPAVPVLEEPTASETAAAAEPPAAPTTTLAPRPAPRAAPPRPAPATTAPAGPTAAERAAVQKAAADWEALRERHGLDDVRSLPSTRRAIDLGRQANRALIAGDLEAALSAYRQASTLLTQAAAEAEQARRQATRATPEPAPAATPAPATPAPATPSPEQAIRDTLARYERAIENEDLALFRSVKPNLTSAEEKRLKASFDAVDSHEVTLDVQQIRVAGTTAEVEINRRDTIAANGNSRDNRSRQTVLLEQRGDGWVIVAFKR